MLALIQESSRSPFRKFKYGVWGLGALVLLHHLPSCSTGAIGVQDCREIENARCEASIPCDIIEEEELEDCERFYKDQCLHGFVGSAVATASGQKACVDLIKSAGKTADETSENDDDIDEYEEACEIVSTPWKHPTCAYLSAQGHGGESGDGDGDGDGDNDDGDSDDDG